MEGITRSIQYDIRVELRYLHISKLPIRYPSLEPWLSACCSDCLTCLLRDLRCPRTLTSTEDRGRAAFSFSTRSCFAVLVGWWLRREFEMEDRDWGLRLKIEIWLGRLRLTGFIFKFWNTMFFGNSTHPNPGWLMIETEIRDGRLRLGIEIEDWHWRSKLTGSFFSFETQFFRQLDSTQPNPT